MAYVNRNKRFKNREHQYNTSKENQLRQVGDYILHTYSFKNIPYQYFETLKEYSQKVRKIKLKVKTEKDEKGKIWPVSFNVYKVSAVSSAG